MALGDEAFQRASIDLMERWRPWLTQQIGGLGLDVIGPSAANFVLVGFPKRPGKTAALLLRSSVGEFNPSQTCPRSTQPA